MNSEKKYPYIAQHPLSDKLLVITGKGKGVKMEGDFEEIEVSTSSEFNSKNITQEYLSNTWGVVESKEHAEFIVELARSAGLITSDTWDNTHDYFSVNYNGLLFWSGKSHAESRGEKQITIPLPPNASVDEITPEEEFELHQNQAVQALNNTATDAETWPSLGDRVTTYGQQGDVILPADKNGFYIINADGLYLAAKEKDITECEQVENEDTWLQVGDEVCWSNGHRKGELKCIHDGWAWVKVDEDDFASIKTDKLTKPKSKEDLLIEELQTKLCENNYVDNYTLANDIVNGMIEGLVYEPK